MGKHLLTAKDVVDVVDDEGNDLGYQVPKHWGADQLAPGTKKKSGRASSSTSTSGSGSSTPPPAPDVEPAGNAGRDAWVAYATKVKGAKDEDLLDADGKELGRDELRTKFGTPPAS